MARKRQRTPHFIRGLGNGNVGDKSAVTRNGNDDILGAGGGKNNAWSLGGGRGSGGGTHSQSQFVRTRAASGDELSKSLDSTNERLVRMGLDTGSNWNELFLFNNENPSEDGSNDGPRPVPRAGPWQMPSTFALLGVIVLLSALFLHLVSESSTDKSRSNHRRRKSKQGAMTRKKKTDEWVEDELDLLSDGCAYAADNEGHGAPSEPATALSQPLLSQKSQHVPLFYPYPSKYPQQQQHRQRKSATSSNNSQQQPLSPNPSTPAQQITINAAIQNPFQSRNYCLSHEDGAVILPTTYRTPNATPTLKVRSNNNMHNLTKTPIQTTHASHGPPSGSSPHIPTSPSYSNSGDHRIYRTQLQSPKNNPMMRQQQPDQQHLSSSHHNSQQPKGTNIRQGLHPVVLSSVSSFGSTGLSSAVSSERENPSPLHQSDEEAASPIVKTADVVAPGQPILNNATQQSSMSYGSGNRQLTTSTGSSHRVLLSPGTDDAMEAETPRIGHRRQPMQLNALDKYTKSPSRAASVRHNFSSSNHNTKSRQQPQKLSTILPTPNVPKKHLQVGMLNTHSQHSQQPQQPQQNHPYPQPKMVPPDAQHKQHQQQETFQQQQQSQHLQSPVVERQIPFMPHDSRHVETMPSSATNTPSHQQQQRQMKAIPFIPKLDNSLHTSIQSSSSVQSSVQNSGTQERRSSKSNMSPHNPESDAANANAIPYQSLCSVAIDETTDDGRPESLYVEELKLVEMESGNIREWRVDTGENTAEAAQLNNNDNKTNKSPSKVQEKVNALTAGQERASSFYSGNSSSSSNEEESTSWESASSSANANDPRKTIIHKRKNLTAATDAASSLQSSISFKELKLRDVIGGGGFGQVWRATWRGTPVAVKVLTGSAQSTHVSKAILEEFAAEINLLKGMRHPNICLYMGASVDPPNRAIITELAANGSLWDALRLPLSPPFVCCDGVSRDTWRLELYNRGPHGAPPIPGSSGNFVQPPIPPKGSWPWILVKRVACGAARGMAYLHSGKPPILHRDLKSANILLDESYTAKVCDFGLSRLKAQERSMTGNCGTVQWMAPEVLANQSYNEKADVFSFGVICWELLSRECPYEGMNAIQCALAVLNRDHRPTIPKWCPPALHALITACFNKDMKERPTFSQIIKALDALPP